MSSMTKESSDAQLISSILLFDDHKAFRILMERYQPQLRGLLIRLTDNDVELTNDLLQETFLTVYRRLATFNGKSAFGTWLYQVAYRQFLQMKRAQNPKSVEIYKDDSQNGVQTHPAIAVGHRMDIDRAMSYLREEERMAVYLSYAEGYHHEEIGEIMQIPLGTVKTHIARGRKKLKDLLG